MNITDVGGLYRQLLPFLRQFGLDPDKIGRQLGRSQVESRLLDAAPAVEKRLTKDGWTPVVKAGEPKLERQLIRNCLYLLLKEALPLPAPLKPHAADLVRDIYDDKTVQIVAPVLQPSHSTADLVRMVTAAFLDIAF